MELNLDVNFETSNSSVKDTSVTKITGNLKKGNWKKKRIDAKRIIKRIKKNSNSDVSASVAESIVGSNSNTIVHTPSGNVKENHPKSTVPVNNQKRVISSSFSSSIFTCNPEISKPIEPAAEPSKVVQANKGMFRGDSFQGLVDILLAEHLEKLKIVQPTAVQSQGIPIIKKHQNVIVKAQTGSGKTLAFLLPILDKLIHASKGNLFCLFLSLNGPKTVPFCLFLSLISFIVAQY